LIKRLVLILFLGLLVTVSFAGTRKYQYKEAITIIGVASGDDSTATDTFAIFTTNHYANRYWITIDFDSVVPPETGHYPSGFGLRDTIIAVIKAEYAGQYITLDSTLDSLKVAAELTLDFTSDAGDSLYKYGEQVYLIIRIADTVGATTDSAHTFNFTIRAKHSYQD
jgi:hypothetical protein